MGVVQNFKKQFAWKHFINYFVLIAVIILFVLLNSFGVLKKGDRSTLTRIGYSMILAVSLNLIVGFLGELSLGHAGFMCVGAYIGCFVFQVIAPVTGNGVWTLLISMLAGGATAAVFGFIIGIPALRLKGDYLAITTLAFGEIVRNVFKNLPFFGGAKGLSTDLYDSNSLFIIAFITLFLFLVLFQNLIRSKHGRAITAIRDNEIAAHAMGINVTYYKLLIFVIAAFAAGVAGVLYGKTVGVVRQDGRIRELVPLHTEKGRVAAAEGLLAQIRIRAEIAPDLAAVPGGGKVAQPVAEIRAGVVGERAVRALDARACPDAFHKRVHGQAVSLV